MQSPLLKKKEKKGCQENTQYIVRAMIPSVATFFMTQAASLASDSYTQLLVGLKDFF